MKKIDLHIHTVNTQSDPDFEFSLDALKGYVKEKALDAIAITNHNLFDEAQYNEIANALAGITTVYPGIEINIGTRMGHLLLIANSSNVADFASRCAKIQEHIVSPSMSVSVQEFMEIFPNLGQYMLIPHMEKSPAVDAYTLSMLGDHICCGEVGSIKKFVYYQKDDTMPTPVYFSDFRPVEDVAFPIRSTFIDTDDISLPSMKLCLQDKTKVMLSAENGNSQFTALPYLTLSTGLNVVIGGRSSGKSYTLNRLNEQYENVKYIRQFQLLEVDPSKAEQEFSEKLAAKQGTITRDYFLPFSKVVDEVKDISVSNNEKAVDAYITSLIKYAEEQERADAFSRCAFYSESDYSIDNQDGITDLIEATMKLLDSKKYRDIIERNVSRESLIALLKDLIAQYQSERELVLKKLWVNDLLSDVKRGLQSRTAATRVEDVDFYKVQMDSVKVDKFNRIVRALQRESVIHEKEIEGFKIQARKRKYNGAGELKSHSGRVVTFSNIFPLYSTDPYEFLLGLKQISELSDDKYYEYFAKVEHVILNSYGCEVSGGERAEFNLLQEINDAYQYDMLLIDEPESSFDNIFLKERVNHIIKEISQQMPVIIVTHNSTVGASIHPDFVINTVRTIIGKEAHYDVFYGEPGNKELMNCDGKRISNLEAMLNCLEAGEIAYDERRREYEMLKN
ncbi:MAG: histidinol-phosphatase [Bacillota bacterium]|jgi:hypothetical protein|nr:histidinol-phosphatase [Bacillota bacterium]